MVKILNTGTEEVTIKLIREMFEACPELNMFYISKRDMDRVIAHNEDDPDPIRSSHFINPNDSAWHSQIMMVEEMDATNTFIGTSDKGDIVMAIIHEPAYVQSGLAARIDGYQHRDYRE
jgi:hypothetical protein